MRLPLIAPLRIITLRLTLLPPSADRVSSFDGLMSTSNHLLPDEPVVTIRTSRPIWWTMELRPIAAPSRRSIEVHDAACCGGHSN